MFLVEVVTLIDRWHLVGGGVSAFGSRERGWFLHNFEAYFHIFGDVFNLSNLAGWLTTHFSVVCQTHNTYLFLLYTDFKILSRKQKNISIPTFTVSFFLFFNLSPILLLCLCSPVWRRPDWSRRRDSVSKLAWVVRGGGGLQLEDSCRGGQTSAARRTTVREK